MLSLSPRFDLFKFELPKDFFPEEVLTKYRDILIKNKSVLTDPVEYINESIQGVNIPGIKDLIVEQKQTSTNPIIKDRFHINREPDHENATKTPSNPIEQIDKTMTVIFRQNQGLMNYFMLYETIFWHHCKDTNYSKGEDIFQVWLLSETGVKYASIQLFQPIITGIDGLEFNYSKIQRDTETFNAEFRFNNINFDFLPKT